MDVAILENMDLFSQIRRGKTIEFSVQGTKLKNITGTVLDVHFKARDEFAVVMIQGLQFHIPFSDVIRVLN